jgi:hypothetical protein
MKFSLVIDLDSISDEHMLALVHLLRNIPNSIKKMSQTISEAATDLNVTIDHNIKTRASERARKAANARWSKKATKSEIPKELSSMIQVNRQDDVPSFDGRDIMEGNYPGGPAYGKEPEFDDTRELF